MSWSCREGRQKLRLVFHCGMMLNKCLIYHITNTVHALQLCSRWSSTRNETKNTNIEEKFKTLQLHHEKLYFFFEERIAKWIKRVSLYESFTINVTEFPCKLILDNVPIFDLYAWYDTMHARSICKVWTFLEISCTDCEYLKVIYLYCG